MPKFRVCRGRPNFPANFPAGSCLPKKPSGSLLQLDRSPSIFDLFLDIRRLGLAYAFLDRLRRTVDQVLGLLETQTRKLAHDLDHLDLLVARTRQHDRELVLLDRRG